MLNIRRAFALSLLFAIGAVLRPAMAHAQAPARDGFFIGFGLGWGSFGVEDAEDRQSGVAGHFRLGGALSDKVLLGAESDAWVREEGGITVTSSSLAAVAYVYPQPTSGFFLKGGLGIASLSLDAGDLGDVTETGTSLLAGAGYDIGFGGRFGLSPYGTFVIGNFDGGSTTVFQLGLGFTWY